MAQNSGKTAALNKAGKGVAGATPYHKWGGKMSF